MLLSPSLLGYSWLLCRTPYSGVGAGTWQLLCYGSGSLGGGHCFWLCSNILCTGLGQKHPVLTETSCHGDMAEEGKLAQMLATGSLLSWGAMTSSQEDTNRPQGVDPTPREVEIFPLIMTCVKIWLFCLLERCLCNKRGTTFRQCAPRIKVQTDHMPKSIIRILFNHKCEAEVERNRKTAGGGAKESDRETD